MEAKVLKVAFEVCIEETIAGFEARTMEAVANKACLVGLAYPACQSYLVSSLDSGLCKP